MDVQSVKYPESIDLRVQQSIADTSLHVSAHDPVLPKNFALWNNLLRVILQFFLFWASLSEHLHYSKE